MRKYTITALDKDGQVIYSETTYQSYFITAISYHIFQLIGLLISGRARTVLIEAVEVEGGTSD
ncbi:MAG: hypothetical protein KAS39_04850 [Actinomycetia bacterium]|nr:hypothetical protein [Actinomycetes bacterium]